MSLPDSYRCNCVVGHAAVFLEGVARTRIVGTSSAGIWKRALPGAFSGSEGETRSGCRLELRFVDTFVAKSQQLNSALQWNRRQPTTNKQRQITFIRATEAVKSMEKERWSEEELAVKLLFPYKNGWMSWLYIWRAVLSLKGRTWRGRDDLGDEVRLR